MKFIEKSNIESRIVSDRLIECYKITNAIPLISTLNYFANKWLIEEYLKIAFLCGVNFTLKELKEKKNDTN